MGGGGGRGPRGQGWQPAGAGSEAGGALGAGSGGRTGIREEVAAMGEMSPWLQDLVKQAPTVGVLLVVLWRLDAIYLPLLLDLRTTMVEVRELLRQQAAERVLTGRAGPRLEVPGGGWDGGD